MRGKQTLVINGKVYDAVTGLPVAAPEKTVQHSTTPVIKASPAPVVSVEQRSTHHSAHAKHTHSTTKKSATLRREYVKKPVGKAQHTAQRHKPSAGHIDRSPQIHKFAPHPQPLQAAPRPKVSPKLDITPVKNKPSSIIAQKHALVASPALAKPVTPLNTRSVREQLISERMAAVDTTAKPAKTPKQHRSLFAKQPRTASFVAASFAVMILGGYMTYLNMPSLSVRVAAAQAGVAASFPDYHPDGYRFNGPVAYTPGQVAIDFVANGGNAKYTVTEQKSTWDSQAVYDNLVAKAADDSYVTNSQQGLTIYTYKGEAAWVNKGILYTIEGEAPLSNEQLLRIAGSL